MEGYLLAEIAALANISAHVTQNLSGTLEDYVWEDFKRVQYTLDEPSTRVLVVAYSVVFILAVVGNIMVLVVILCNKAMRSVTNYFLVNLAVSDLMGEYLTFP